MLVTDILIQYCSKMQEHAVDPSIFGGRMKVDDRSEEKSGGSDSCLEDMRKKNSM